MSLLARSAIRSVVQSAPRRGARCYSEEIIPAIVKPTAEWVAQKQALKHHAHEASELWRKISFYVCIPAIITGGIWVYKVEKDHHEHLDHLRAENGGVLPQPPDYEYLNRRVKPFPWGMNSLFFNPEVNKDLEAE